MKKNRNLLVIALYLFAGRFAGDDIAHVNYYTVQRYDVVIDELMADPTPPVGLPGNEWIEIKNTSAFPVNLSGWRIADASSSSSPMPNFILDPDSIAIVCSSSAAATMSAFGKTIPVTGFPSLDNGGDMLVLKDGNGKVIHALAYDISWYGNELKKEGGWTLEMIDTNNPCAGGSNWRASINNAGGTPGKRNSVNALNDDQTSPRLKRAYTTDELTIVLVFDEPVDSIEGANASNYSIDGAMTIAQAITLPSIFDKVQLKLNAPMLANKIYTVTANNVGDCKQNMIGGFNQAKFGLPVDAVTAEMIVNEILFNPRPNSGDYVEFYNKSNKIFDASRLYIANRNSSNAISSVTQISANPFLIFPGDYIVVTEDAESLAREYFVKNPAWVLTPSSLPSFPDDKGAVLLLNFQGTIVDEVDYIDDWHFRLLADAEGVALERIDPGATSGDAANWHSAGSTAGYGTPTYRNSQYRQPPGANASIEVSPKVFSPDNDGFDDVATIQYQVDQPGYVANISIFDAAGRPVRNLVRNGTMAISGYWNWDGLDDKGKKLAIGPYVIFTEIFNLQGRKNAFKNIVVLAKKLN